MRKEPDISTGRRRAFAPPSSGTTRIAIRLDDDLLDWFRAQPSPAEGGDYQTLINEALWKFIATQDETIEEEPLEELVRKVIREELQRARSGAKSRPRRAIAAERSRAKEH